MDLLRCRRGCISPKIGHIFMHSTLCCSHILKRCTSRLHCSVLLCPPPPNQTTHRVFFLFKASMLRYLLSRFSCPSFFHFYLEKSSTRMTKRFLCLFMFTFSLSVQQHHVSPQRRRRGGVWNEEVGSVEEYKQSERLMHGYFGCGDAAWRLARRGHALQIEAYSVCDKAPLCLQFFKLTGN